MAQRVLNMIERRHITVEKKRHHAIDIQARKELCAIVKMIKTTAESSRIPPTKIVKLAYEPRTTIRKSATGLVVVLDDGGSLQVQVITSQGRTTTRTIQGSK